MVWSGSARSGTASAARTTAGCAWIAARLPVEVVTDARVIQAHYRTAYHRATHYFPYGTDLERVDDDGTLEALGLAAKGYVLYVSRLEPENNADVVIDAYGKVATTRPLVIVGDAPYADAYIESLHDRADDRVRFVGAIYGRGYEVLRSHAALYVQATEVGGTHPALVEAMGSANAIIANDVPEHRETLGDAGRFYRGVDELSVAITELLADDAATDALRVAAHRRAEERFGWESIVTDYERWFIQLIDRKSRPERLIGRRQRSPRWPFGGPGGSQRCG